MTKFNINEIVRFQINVGRTIYHYYYTIINHDKKYYYLTDRINPSSSALNLSILVCNKNFKTNSNSYLTINSFSDLCNFIKNNYLPEDFYKSITITKTSSIIYNGTVDCYRVRQKYNIFKLSLKEKIKLCL